MKVVQFSDAQSGSPDSKAWHEWRAKGVGASDAPVIASHYGLCKPASWMDNINDLYFYKTGIYDPKKSNWVMERGRAFETVARERYEEITGEFVSPMFGEMEEYPFIRASFDGLSMEMDRIVEVKVPGDDVHALAEQGIVVGYYIPQLAHQALVAWGHPDQWDDEKHFIDFCSYQPDTEDLQIVPVKPSQIAYIARSLIDYERDFMECVSRGFPPVGGEQLMALNKEIAPLLKQKHDLEQTIECVRDLIIERADAGETLTFHNATKSKGRKCVDYESVIQMARISPRQLEAFRGEGGGWMISSRHESHDYLNPLTGLESLSNLELILINCKKSLKVVQESVDALKGHAANLADELGESALYAPNFSLTETRGRVSYAKACEALKVDEKIILKFTSYSEDSYSLRAKKAA